MYTICKKLYLNVKSNENVFVKNPNIKVASCNLDCNNIMLEQCLKNNEDGHYKTHRRLNGFLNNSKTRQKSK